MGFGARARAGGIPCGGGRRLRPSGSAEESNKERTAHFGGPPLHPLAAHRDQSEGVGSLIHRNLVDASRARAQVPCMGLPVRCTAAAAVSRAHLHNTVLWRACHFRASVALIRSVLDAHDVDAINLVDVGRAGQRSQ